MRREVEFAGCRPGTETKARRSLLNWWHDDFAGSSCGNSILAGGPPWPGGPRASGPRFRPCDLRSPARLRGAVAPGAACDRARHVRDRLGRAAALLVARAARDPARAARYGHQRQYRSARADHPERDASALPRQAAGVARARKRRRLRGRASHLGSTARRGGSCCAARRSFRRCRAESGRHARSAWSSTSRIASSARRPMRCMLRRCTHRRMRSSRSILIDHQDMESVARNASMATRPRK